MNITYANTSPNPKYAYRTRQSFGLTSDSPILVWLVDQSARARGNGLVFGAVVVTSNTDSVDGENMKMNTNDDDDDDRRRILDGCVTQKRDEVGVCFYVCLTCALISMTFLVHDVDVDVPLSALDKYYTIAFSCIALVAILTQSIRIPREQRRIESELVSQRFRYFAIISLLYRTIMHGPLMCLCVYFNIAYT